MTDSNRIHPSAIIEDGAKLAQNVCIGPYCVIGRNVEIGKDSVLHSHIVISGHTKIGEGNQIFPFASIGTQPQDLKYQGEDSKLIIGNHNRIREHVTINPGTKGGGMITQIGDDNLLMVGVHVAHDCMLGNHIIMANNATLAGHVTIEDNAIIGGLSAIHQFVRIGKGAMIGGMSGVEFDVIPHGLVMGERANLRGLNLIGLQRRGLEKSVIRELQACYQALFTSKENMSAQIDGLKDQYAHHDMALEMIEFSATALKQRGLTKPS